MRTRVVVNGALLAFTGCVLADPPPTLPPPAMGPPTILTGVTPQGPVIAGAWPEEFVIPVSVADPTQPLLWIALEDYGSSPGSTNILPEGSPTAVTPGPDAGNVIQLVVTNLVQPPGDGCHTVEIIVAYGFTGPTPTTVGGSVAQWLFTTSQDPGDCTQYDAGALADGTFPDASQDAPVDAGGL